MNTSGPYAVGPFSLALESGDGQVLDRFAALMSGFAPSDTARPQHRLVLDRVDGCSTAHFGGDLLCSANDPISFELAVTRALNMRVLDAEPDRLHLHAGAVTRDGQTVLIVGRSMSGKSTLVAKLVSLGWEYLTDEQVAVTADGRILPYPRSITLRAGSWSLFDGLIEKPAGITPATSRFEVPPSDLGSVYRGPALAPTLVVSPDASREDLAVAPLTMAETASLLLSESLDSARSGQAGVDAMIAVAASTPGYSVTGQQLQKTCAAIADLAENVTPGGTPARSERVDDSEVSLRIPGTQGWLFVDGSAAIFESEAGVLARLEEQGFDAWVGLSEVSPSSENENLGDFARELQAAGLARGSLADG